MEKITLGSHRLVHLDLKGAPPRLSYFEQIFPLFRDWGATGLLIEWEDSFPFYRELLPIGSNSPSSMSGGYTVQEAKQILQLAADCGLTVIPLVQSIGHLEFVLKHEEWRHLREVEAYPSCICPSNSGSIPLIILMLRQVIDLHPDIQYIHIGADEVWHMGRCETCVRKMEEKNQSCAHLFLEYIIAIIQQIRDTYPNLKIIIWDDMLRCMDISVLREYNIGFYAEPMVWHYQSRENFILAPELWEKFSTIFQSIWVATAFKGASGSCQNLPVICQHVSNHEKWLQVLERESLRFTNFRGVAITGWSRYDHYGTLCELLPVALPSLCLCLKVWTTGSYSTELHMNVAKSLGYSDVPLSLCPFPRPQPVSAQLNFPGWRVLKGVEWFANLQVRCRSIIDSDQVETWLNPWQIAHGFTNPMQIESLAPAFTELLFDLSSLENYLQSCMEEILFSSAADEWIGTRITPLKEKIRQLKKTTDAQILIGARPSTVNVSREEKV